MNHCRASCIELSYAQGACHRHCASRGSCPSNGVVIAKSRVCTDATTGIERAAGEGEPQKARAAENLGGLDHGNPTFITKSCRISRRPRLTRTPFR
eukprot:scaffold22587_cov86-Phaeocystis_antarctica.AAC.1